MCEYTTEPVMGNIFEDSLKALWQSDKWNKFRLDLHEKCSLCPLHLHKGLPLRCLESEYSDGNRDMLHRIYYSRSFRPFRPVAKKLIDFCREYIQ